MLLGAFAQRAAAVTRGEASPFELTAASPEERDAPARTRDSNEDTKDTVVETSAGEEATTNAGEEATIHARANVASESEATVSAGDARASAKRSPERRLRLWNARWARRVDRHTRPRGRRRRVRSRGYPRRWWRRLSRRRRRSSATRLPEDPRRGGGDGDAEDDAASETRAFAETRGESRGESTLAHGARARARSYRFRRVFKASGGGAAREIAEEERR